MLKQSILNIILDIILINISLILAFFIRFGTEIPPEFVNHFGLLLIFATIARIIVFFSFNIYKIIWKYAGIKDILRLVSAVTVGSTIIVTAVFFNRDLGYPRSVVLIDWFLNLFLIGGYRLFPFIKPHIILIKPKLKGKRTLIIGAGEAGTMVVREMERNPDSGYVPVGFIDDDPSKINMRIHGIKVLGKTEDIKDIVQQLNIEQIVIAIPSAPPNLLKKFIDICASLSHLGVKFKIVPGITEIINGEVNLSHLKEIEFEDLLGREEVKLQEENISSYLKDKKVLITGAGGSIGSELTKQVLKFNPKMLILIDKDEYNIYNLEMELNNFNPESKRKFNTEIISIISDIKDESKMERIIEKYKPSCIFHAAAYKHVPLMEENPDEAVKNNIYGTKVMADLAIKYNVDRFVMISTDKAVNPTSVMGASKRVAEMIIQSLAEQHVNTKFMSVRFGNVLGSRGSVIPLFEKQIAKGGPVTVTHPDVTRYFMSIEEAAQLVIQAGSMGEKGEIFVLDMGQQVKISDLAKDLIKFRGYTPDIDIKIKYIGLRPGEKLYEELLTQQEGLNPSFHKKIFIAKPEKINIKKLEKDLEDIIKLVNSKDVTKEQIINKLKEIVPSYNPKRE
jgi:FlaA1/EpsC-like NDP-sugar epimerase